VCPTFHVSCIWWKQKIHTLLYSHLRKS
jgi:hypothetical protein